MNVRAVRKSELKEAASAPWRDPERKVYVKGDTAYVPVRDGERYDTVIPERAPYTGRGYQKMGDTLLFHGTEPTAEELGAADAFEHPDCILYSAGQDGVMRIPKITVLKGEPHEVTFKEAGISYTLHPAKVMFSQGNREEKLRLKRCIRAGERVADMFAGIGYFTLTAAKAGARVHAMEINPESFFYLQKNIEANGLSAMVTAENGDCRSLLKGTYDRILMGHFDSPDFLPEALHHSTAGTTLHIHGLGDREADIEAAVVSAGFRYRIAKYKVKKYAAHTMHYVWDVTLL